MPWSSSGGASVTGGPTTYNVSWTSPTYSYPSGSTNRSLTSSGGATSISCGTSTTRTWRATWFQSPFGWEEDYTSVTATAPSCPPASYLNLTATLTQNNGTMPGPYPGIWYRFTALNQDTQSRQVSWSIPGLGLSGSRILEMGESYTWQTPDLFIPASYSTTYTGTITGTSSAGTETASSSVTTPDPPPVAVYWIDNTLANTFRVGEAYSDAVTAGGTGPISYAVTAGSLPDGISLNTSSGAVTGTPTTAGAYSFTITATGGYGSPITAAFSGTVAKPRGEINFWNGTEWVQEPVRYWSGSAWTVGELYVYDGTTWVKTF